MRLEIILLLAITSVNVADSDNDKKNKIFVASKEWKVIGEEQQIPPGLHVRINLQTGKKEAKLLDVDEKHDEKSSGMVMSSVVKDDTEQDTPKSTHSQRKDALKNIPDEGVEYSEEKLKEVTKKFRSYESLKQELDEMNVNIKSDFQLMSQLFEKYEAAIIDSTPDLIEIRTIFEDLEYLLHQIDNANDFVTAGGLEKVILPNLSSNQTISELRIHSVKLLGILVQNNPKGQIAAFEKNVGSVLLQLLSQSTSSSSSSIIGTTEMSSILFALGGLLRKFPLAQEELLTNPGLKILIDLLGKQVVDYKIKIKCLLLITDLIQEYDEAIGNIDFNKTKQYNATDIKNRLSTTEYCSVMVELMTIHRPDYLESLYIADDILNVLVSSKEICVSEWEKSLIFRHALLAIKNSYEHHINQTDFDDGSLKNVVDKLENLRTFYLNHTVMVNDEL